MQPYLHLPSYLKKTAFSSVTYSPRARTEASWKMWASPANKINTVYTPHLSTQGTCHQLACVHKQEKPYIKMTSIVAVLTLSSLQETPSVQQFLNNTQTQLNTCSGSCRSLNSLAINDISILSLWGLVLDSLMESTGKLLVVLMTN